MGSDFLNKGNAREFSQTLQNKRSPGREFIKLRGKRTEKGFTGFEPMVLRRFCVKFNSWSTKATFIILPCLVLGIITTLRSSSVAFQSD